ncbi:ATP-binding cassette subfamily F protein 3 [Keratinibaculum paraultunense]|uniref:ATP-binding cassette subfamily F protein 3 n=1 Tax=Keratinibaculum paraultunense TaxID=1278232 RepID=A0A4R3KZJ0_9FIRM|nr:ABC-F family ATP-binding cassette domain-containing protein [Keratinibaculum paraultunense]QQY80106.1 ABC-F family ATP-binding cassette domain-containing protein [Keratinibaculum paraultunense]TCS91572.1 ATP-binding cassette subfamily F protein 3 [Keratinibaculum paraultunense]
MIVLSCNNISKSYGVNEILKNISFTVENGDKIGLIGLNGSGKTTLFNILAGETHKDAGEIYIRKDLKIGYLKQHTYISGNDTLFNECLNVFKPLLEMEKKLRKLEQEISIEGSKTNSTRLEKLMEDYAHIMEKFDNNNGYGYRSEIKGVLKGLGFKDKDMDKRVNILSGGQKSRLSLAKLLLEKPDLLLLDEPTNHLDIEAINWLENYLKEYTGAILVISHDRYFLDNIVSKIFLLENKEIKIYNMNYSQYMKQRKKDIELLKKQYEDQQKEIKRQEEIIKRFSNYGDSRYIKQAQSRQKMLDKIKLIDKPINNKKAKITFKPNIKSGRDVLRVENLNKSFNEHKLLEDISFAIYRGEKVGLIGPNGVGKTTLFKIILNQIPYDSGTISLGHNVHIGYFDQEQTKLNLNKTVIDEIWDDNPKLNYYEIRSLLSKFLFIGDDIFKEISELSGGERARLALLKMMLSNANFLLMDEPTNHLDIDSKEVLEDALMNYEGTLFVISHDRYFLNKVVNKVFELTEEGIKEYLGNYNYYLEKKNEVAIKEYDDYKTKTQIKLERKKQREKLEAMKKKKKEIIKLEKMIEQKETNMKEIDKLLCDPNIYDKPEKVIELTKKRETLEIKINALYDQWIKLTEE